MNPSDPEYACNLLPFEREEVLSIQDVQQKVGWEITAFNLPKAWEFTQGEGVTVAVLDTGADLDHEDLVENLLPGRNFIDPSKPPHDDNGHGCVSPETLVHTSYSGIVEIEKLYNSLELDEETICNHDGCYSVKNTEALNIRTCSLDSENIKSVVSKIQSIQKLPIKGEIVNIHLEGNVNFKLTPWHPVYLLKNKHHDVYEVIRKRADEICVGDHFIFPNNIDLGESQFASLCDKFACQNCKHEPKYWIGDIPKKCKKCQKNEWNLITKELEITEDIAWLCGIVITDGYVSTSSQRVEISSTTIEILEKAKSICEKLGFNSVIENKRILIYGKNIVQLMLSLEVCDNKKSLNQTLPSWVGKSKHSIIAAFIAGVIDGDGCISKTNTKNRITTASFQFAQEFCALLNYMGISSGYGTPKFDNRQRCISSKNPVYQITHAACCLSVVENLAHPNKISRSNVKPKHKRRSRRVKKVELQNYDGYFYDFTVEKYHNYIANGHFVSNTHVTGIICASNNDLGVVGVAPKCKVIPIKVLDSKGNGNLINVADGIRWAVDQGADFITMSLGSPNPVGIVQDAIKYALSKGCITWCAAGNAGKTRQIFYPAAYPEVIGIGAIDENFDRAKFSCTGPDLDFVAPGVQILSTVPENWYAVLSGTSMANPFAVGIGTLLLSYKRKKNIQMKLETNNDYIEVLKQYTIPTKNPEFAGQKFFEGFGIIDPRKLEEWVRSQN